MKQLIDSLETKAKGLVVRCFKNSESDILKSIRRLKSYKYCKKNGDVIEDYYKLHNKNKAAEEHKGKQLMNSVHASVVEDDDNDSELLAIFNDDSNIFDECFLDMGCRSHICSNRDRFQHMKLCLKVLSL